MAAQPERYPDVQLGDVVAPAGGIFPGLEIVVSGLSVTVDGVIDPETGQLDVERLVSVSGTPSVRVRRVGSTV